MLLYVILGHKNIQCFFSTCKNPKILVRENDADYVVFWIKLQNGLRQKANIAD